MDGFIKKLIGRLEEQHEKCINRYGVVGGNLPAMEVKQCMEIVNQLAEEYNNDFCKWNYSPFNGDVIKPYHHKGSVGMYKECLKSNPFCSCCGKKIKVVK